MKIIIPSNNINERKYIIDIILGEFLGLDFKLIIDNGELKINNWIIELENGNKLIIEDCFFNKFSNNLEYLKEENIPKNVKVGKNNFIVEKDIPIIYGTNKLITSNYSTIICGIDIFASSFFMLTRWEEYVNKHKDLHNRFLATKSLAFKNNFLDRPIVNEYVEMIWNMLKFLGCKQKREKRKFKFILTHDVDEVKMWKSWKQVFRIVLGDILKRRSLSLALERFAEYFLIKREKIKDPFDTFDWLMDKSEVIGVKSRFYFMSGGVTEFDNSYKLEEHKVLIKRIQKRGHIIGFHPSYNAYNDFELFKREKELLENVAEQKIVEGREHYLRFEVPTTWQIWEDNDIAVDSTCGYADKEGFRCGTGDAFSVFNILTREKLKLKERPLIVMDCSLFDYNNNSYKDANSKINTMKSKANSFTILWHNSYIKHIDFYANYIENFKRI